MFDSTLFLVFPLTDLFQKELLKLSPVERNLFIQDQNPLYLRQIEYEGVFYLGKSLDCPFEMRDLESFQSHIYSLLKKLVPQFPCEQTPLILLPLSESSLDSTLSKSHI